MARSRNARRRRSPIRWRRHAGMDGEGRDVRLVDHEPHPPEADRSRLRRGRRGRQRGGSTRARSGTRSAATASGSSPARWRGRPRGRRAASARCGSSPVVVRPRHLPARGGRAPWQRHVLRDEPREVVATRRAASRAAPRRTRVASPARRAPARRARSARRARPSRSTATSIGRIGGRRVRPGASTASASAACRPAAASVRRRHGRGSGRSARPAAGGGSGTDRPRGPRPRPRCRAAPVATPTIGQPRPWAMPLAVAIPTRSPVKVPGPVPTITASIASRASPRLDRADARPRAAASRRGGTLPASRPRRAHGAVGRAGRHDDAGRRGVDREEDPLAHGIASRYRAWRSPCAVSSISRGSSPLPSMTTSSRSAGIARTEPVGPLDERHAGGPAVVVEQAATDGLGRVGQAVEVDVEQRQPALVLGHEDEARRGDRLGHAESGAERLGEVGLAGPEVAPQAEQVAGPRRRSRGRGRARSSGPGPRSGTRRVAGDVADTGRG